MREPTELEMAMHERRSIGLVPFGPLTYQEVERERDYERWQVESTREYEAQKAAGGRSICPRCGERSVTNKAVATLGGGLPGSEYSTLYSCERDNCDYREI